MPHKRYLAQTWATSHLVIGESHIHGCGVFTTRLFQAGEILMIWGGDLWTAADIITRKARWKSAVSIDEELFLGNSVHAPVTIDEYLNHSCDPNTWMLDEVTVIARRAIQIGEEITSDLALWTDEDYLMTTNCQCLSSLCRHRVTGYDWLLPELQDRYSGYFSPFLNRKISLLRKKRGA